MHPSDFNRQLRESNWFNALNPAKETDMSTNQPNPAQQASDAKADLWREWAIDGMPKDKQRLAEAAFAAGLAARELTAPQGVFPAGFTLTREPDDTPGKNWPDVFVIRRGNDHDEIVQGDSVLLWDFFAALSQPIEPQGAVVGEAMVERACRAICAKHGHDPDERTRYAGSNKLVRLQTGEFYPQWKMHEPEVRIALEAALPVAVGAGEDKS